MAAMANRRDRWIRVSPGNLSDQTSVGFPRARFRATALLTLPSPPVVSCGREQPVTVEIPRELREVVERGTGRRDDVATPVVPPVLLQPVEPSGRRHELPQPRCSRRGVREGPESTLDDRQQCEIERQLPLLGLPHDVRQVRPGTLQHAPELLPVVRIPADFAHDPRVRPVRRRQPATNARPDVGVDCRACGGPGGRRDSHPAGDCRGLAGPPVRRELRQVAAMWRVSAMPPPWRALRRIGAGCGKRGRKR